MKLTTRGRLLCTTAVALTLGVGLAAVDGERRSIESRGAWAATCEPCAANPCNPCAAPNPCAAACNPCTAACNPCAANPCGANPCAAQGAATDCVVPRLACSPCAPGDAELTPEEARAIHECALPRLAAAYAASGLAAARDYPGWSNAATAPYPSATHGGRYVNNYYNPAAAAYADYEAGEALPEGAVLVKDSFSIGANGRASVGPMFLMIKMAAGASPGTRDWRYQLVTPNGAVAGTTGGEGSAGVQFCADCHNAAAETDALWFLPEEFRR